MLRLRYCLVGLMAVVCLVVSVRSDAQIQASANLSIVESGRALDGTQLYSIDAKNADLVKLLRMIYEKAGQEVIVDPDVQGVVPKFSGRNRTFTQLVDAIREGANGALLIRRNKNITHISRTASSVISIQPGGQGPNGVVPSFSSGVGLIGNNLSSNRLARPVTLNASDGAPVLLSQAMAQIQMQTGVPIRIHPSVPIGVRYSGPMIQVPATFALDTIARSGGLRITQQPDGSLLVAMADRSKQTIGPLKAAPVPCPRCKAVIAANWQYCPSCGGTITKPVTVPSPKTNPEEE